MERKFKFCVGEFYHIYNRGVDKRKIFLKKKDYERFIYSLYEFNRETRVLNFKRRVEGFGGEIEIDRGRASFKSFKSSLKIEVSERLVDIACFCLMPNHFHLLLSQKKEEGITKFLLKISTGYAMYFNKKYNRTGALFEGRFKAIHIDKESYFLQLSRYIHLNPLEIIVPQWKEESIKNHKKARKFLVNYKWSSFPYYLRESETNSKEDLLSCIINSEIIRAYFKNSKEYEKFVYSWVGLGDKEKIEQLLLE